MSILVGLLLAISLSAASGFRVFLPLLALSIAGDFGHLPLPDDLGWVGTDNALIMFAIATVLEIIGYYIPWFDHVMDLGATPLAMLAGTIVTATAASDLNPLVQWTLAIAAGGGTAGAIRGLLSLLRIGSTATSGGLGNPIIATIELAIALVLSVLAVTVPVVAGLVVIGLLGYGIYRVWTRFGRKAQPVSAETATDEAIPTQPL